MIQVRQGSLLDACEKYICHQVNCMNAIGSGIAKQLCIKWPQIKSGYHAFNAGFRNPRDLLGQFCPVKVSDMQFVVNVYGQLGYGRDPSVVYTDYRALETAFTSMAQTLDGSFAFPYGFGCGLANGDWNMVLSLMTDCFHDRDVVVYKLHRLFR